jgi:hypothetical protein
MIIHSSRENISDKRFVSRILNEFLKLSHKMTTQLEMDKRSKTYNHQVCANIQHH